MQSECPGIIDDIAYSEFLNHVTAANLDPNNRWVRDYVSISWKYARPFFVHRGLPVLDSQVLEFGCNVGGSTVMLAGLGAIVTAIDINPKYVQIADANVKAHGLSDRVKFQHVVDTRKLTFDEQSYDMVVCNSVLEYVDPSHISKVLYEIDRVLKPGGILFVLGTSSRLWPKEVHSKTWLVNYLPHALDPFLRRLVPNFERGISPWTITNHFQKYKNMDRADLGEGFLKAKGQTSESWKNVIFRLANHVSLALGTSLGLLLPSITVALMKPIHD